MNRRTPKGGSGGWFLQHGLSYIGCKLQPFEGTAIARRGKPALLDTQVGLPRFSRIRLPWGDMRKPVFSKKETVSRRARRAWLTFVPGRLPEIAAGMFEKTWIGTALAVKRITTGRKQDGTRLIRRLPVLGLRAL